MDSSAYTSLQDRPALGGLRERDIDLLLCSELHIAGPLRRLFAGLWNREIVGFEGAWVSHGDEDGESDLVVSFRSETSTLILLVENKVDAPFQPDQQRRYRARAERWQRTDPYPDVKTVLVAPADYFGRSGSDLFDAQVSYEAISDALSTSSDPRSLFLGRALLEGVAGYRRGYAAVPDEAVSRMWTALYEIASVETPLLNPARPTAKPKGAGFIAFPAAKGFSLGDSKRAQVKLKRVESPSNRDQPIRCYVDLEFKDMSRDRLEEVVSLLLDKDMVVVEAGKSASIRIDTAPIDFRRSPDLQIDEIRDWLGHAERLRQFFVKHRPLQRL